MFFPSFIQLPRVHPSHAASTVQTSIQAIPAQSTSVKYDKRLSLKKFISFFLRRHNNNLLLMTYSQLRSWIEKCKLKHCIPLRQKILETPTQQRGFVAKILKKVHFFFLTFSVSSHQECSIQIPFTLSNSIFKFYDNEVIVSYFYRFFQTFKTP